MGNNENILVKMSNAGILMNDKWLVKDVSLEIHKGEIVTIIGPNGSGKSTTAKIALGLFKKINGHVDRYTNKISYVPQKVLIDWTLPLRVIDFMTLTQDLESDEIKYALNLTGVEHLISRNIRELSGGEFQRVLLARAIAKNQNF